MTAHQIYDYNFAFKNFVYINFLAGQHCLKQAPPDKMNSDSDILYNVSLFTPTFSWWFSEKCLKVMHRQIFNILLSIQGSSHPSENKSYGTHVRLLNFFYSKIIVNLEQLLSIQRIRKWSLNLVAQVFYEDFQRMRVGGDLCKKLVKMKQNSLFQYSGNNPICFDWTFLVLSPIISCPEFGQYLNN